MRIFAFGCSLTQYFYPTWADIMLRLYKNKGYVGENWGRSGAGNMFISTRLWEANTIHKFNKDDIILLQWTSMFREDRYHMNKGWHTPGNFSDITAWGERKPFVLNNFHYENPIVWADPCHVVMRDCAIITSTHRALKEIGCKVISTGFRDWQEGWEELPSKFSKSQFLELDDVRAILESYKDELRLAIPPILNALNFGTEEKFFKTRPISVPSDKDEHRHMIAREVHPLTHEAATFIENNIEKLDNDTLEFVDKWKTILDKDKILLYELDWFNKEKYGWSDDRWRP